MSKGSTRRPTFITPEEEDAAWERTFGKDFGRARWVSVDEALKTYPADLPESAVRVDDEHDGECYRCDEDDNGAGGI